MGSAISFRSESTTSNRACFFACSKNHSAMDAPSRPGRVLVRTTLSLDMKPAYKITRGGETMKVLLFGATGMVGQGVLRECLLDPDVERVLAVGRTTTGVENDKLRELVRDDLFDLSAVSSELTGFDACFFCLGVSSAGMTPEEYRRITFDLTLS